MVERLRGPVDDVRPVGVQHCRADGRHVRTGSATDAHGDAELLAALAHERLLVRLPRLDLAAGQLPESGESVRMTSLRREYTRWVAIDDRRRDDDGVLCRVMSSRWHARTLTTVAPRLVHAHNARGETRRTHADPAAAPHERCGRHCH